MNAFEQTRLNLRPIFPPQITVQEIIGLLSSTNPTNRIRSLRAFDVYRLTTIHQMQNNNILLPTSNLLGIMVSRNWSTEPPEVKRIYKRLALETKAFLINHGN